MSFNSVQRLIRSPRGFLTLALLAALLCWSFGLLLAPDRRRFFTSPEWHFQPFYLATHIVVLQLFVLVYRVNFNAGITHFQIDPGEPVADMKRVFSPLACLLALVVAVPFCFLDYSYLTSERYSKMGGGSAVRAIDLLMWCIWCAEWYLNALIWVVLLGFLIKCSWVIQHYRFKSEIEVVLHERHYRPFLRMSAQGATVLLGFSFVTVFYIWYTGGEITDYVGLMITGGLLLIGFLTPWLLLKAKVDRAVRQEMMQLRRQLARDMQRSRQVGADDRGKPHPLEQRLDEVLAMLRITYLEQRHDKIGQTEANAVMLRLLAPAVTIAWQFRQHSAELLGNLGGLIQGLASSLTRAGGG